VAWERFVTALRQIQLEQAARGLRLDDRNAFPAQTTAVPEVALYWEGTRPRLWFRWYKLAGNLHTRDWVEALVERQPPPLAIIGGSSSDRARDLATRLSDVATSLRQAAPLLLITTATADYVPPRDDPSNWVRLDSIYPGRTFRFCFSNGQMARAVADFIWSQDDLRPDTDPVYLVAWKDDPYSLDLADRYHDVFGAFRERRRTAVEAALLWSWAGSLAARASAVPGMVCEYADSDAGPVDEPFWRIQVSHSIGAAWQPNRPEMDVADRLMTERSRRPAQRRPLLVLPADLQPARRFLRALMRISPSEAVHFVVAGGDSPDFNTIFRDRQLAWPIQDLPFSLVFFAHRNPLGTGASATGGFTGIEDVRLYADIGLSLADSAWAGGSLVASAADLAANLRRSSTIQFDADGNRPSGTGECVVCLRPEWDHDRLRTRARLQVHQPELSAPGRWSLVQEFELDYEEKGFPPEAGQKAGGPP
jgi:hypothetical protein